MNLIDQLPTDVLTFKQEAKLSATPAGKIKLVLANMREAFIYGKGVSQGRLRDDAIFSLSYAALTNAARNYKPRLNHKFSGSRFFGYAKPYVRGELFRSWGRAAVVKHGQCVSLPDGLHLIPEEDAPGITVPVAIETVEPSFDHIDIAERWKLVAPVVVSSLSDTEKMVIDLYYRGSFTFEEIGKFLMVSRSAIQNTHCRALKKIRGALRKNGTLTTL